VWSIFRFRDIGNCGTNACPWNVRRSERERAINFPVMQLRYEIKGCGRGLDI
jgi:hypothetical protein